MSGEIEELRDALIRLQEILRQKQVLIAGMSEPKFTPGRWSIHDPAGDGHSRILIWEKGGDTSICEVDPLNCEANAWLIRAAPDLYELIDRMNRVLKLPGFNDEMSRALAKARGEG